MKKRSAFFRDDRPRPDFDDAEILDRRTSKDEFGPEPISGPSNENGSASRKLSLPAGAIQEFFRDDRPRPDFDWSELDELLASRTPKDEFGPECFTVQDYMVKHPGLRMATAQERFRRMLKAGLIEFVGRQRFFIEGKYGKKVQFRHVYRRAVGTSAAQRR